MDEERLKSGIPGLDTLVQGGMPSNNTYVIVGGQGTGKTTLGAQFIHNGAVEFNDPGVIIILEEDKQHFYRNMLKFGFDFESLEAEGRVKVIPYIRSIIGDIMATLGKNIPLEESEKIREYLTINSLLMEIEHAVESIGAKRVLVDPLSIITLFSESEARARMQCLVLFQKLRELNATSLVVVEEGISFWEDSLFLADGVFQLLLQEKKGIYERAIVVKKVRGTDHDTGMRPLKITANGVRIYSDEIVFR